MVLPILSSISVIMLAAWYSTSWPEDWWYFSIGIMFVSALFILLDLASILTTSRNHQFELPLIWKCDGISIRCLITTPKHLIEEFVIFKVKKNKGNLIVSSNKYCLASILVFLIMMCFMAFPVFNFKKNLIEVNQYPFKSYNYSQPKDEPKTIKATLSGALQLEKMYFFQHDDNVLYNFRQKLNDFLAANKLEKTPVFITNEIWNEVEQSVPPFFDFDEKWRLPNNYIIALAFASFISNPILHGIPDHHPFFYGFYFYHGEGKRLDNVGHVDCKRYSKFVHVLSFSVPKFEVIDCKI